ncbi:MAG: hypothetical protein P8Z72_02310, partial [Gammaproteobacteria bacterium]
RHKYAEKDINSCETHGAFSLYAYYQLDLCLKYKGASAQMVKEARNVVSAFYPKLKSLIDKKGPVARHAWSMANTWLPDDFSKKEYSQMLKNMCESDVYVLHLVTKNQEWKAALSCWR